MRQIRAVKWLFDFYLFGNFHIAFCAVALTLTTQSMFHLTLRSELLVFTFCGTLLGYNLQRLPWALEKQSVELRCRRHCWNTQHTGLLTVLSVMAAIAFGGSFARLYLRTQIIAVLPGALSLAYAFPICPARPKWIQLREIPGIKIFVIALTWSCSCALLPIVASHRVGEAWFSLAAILWSVCCGALIFALTIPFDIRDLPYDADSLKTLPASLGVRTSVRLAIGALFVSAAIPWLIGSHVQAVTYSAWCLIAGCFIYKSSPERHEYYFSFLIDGSILLLLGMFWMCRFQ